METSIQSLISSVKAAAIAKGLNNVDPDLANATVMVNVLAHNTNGDPVSRDVVCSNTAPAIPSDHSIVLWLNTTNNTLNKATNWKDAVPVWAAVLDRVNVFEEI